MPSLNTRKRSRASDHVSSSKYTDRNRTFRACDTSVSPHSSATRSMVSKWRSRNLISFLAATMPTASTKPANSSPVSRIWPPFRPVAPLHTSRASSMTTEGILDLASWLLGLRSWRRVRAIDAPVMPEPMMTVSASVGREVDWQLDS